MHNQYVTKDGKTLRCGFTTGSCATAASKAAAMMLLVGQDVTSVHLVTPSGTALDIPIVEITRQGDAVRCAVQKDSGDDPDITNGMLLYAEVRKISGAGVIEIEGGKGIGRVTKPGLNQPVGNAAINSTPRATITQALREVAEDYGYTGGFSVEFSAPEGERLAKKTYNGRLGIVGGLSILGTSGMVEPMSEDAIIQTIYIQIDVRQAAGDRYLLLTPGNYGQAFIRDTYPIPDDIPIKCSNFIGKAIDYAYQQDFEGVVVVGHAGKLLKLGCGLFQTHSKYGDCRAEVIATAAALYGAAPDTIAAILAAVTSDEMLATVQAAGLQAPVLAKVMERIWYHLNGRVYGERKVAAVMFTDAAGIWGKTAQADDMLRYLAKKYA